MRIEVSVVCRGVLSEGPTEADLDAAIERVCRRLYGRDAGVALRAVRHVVDVFAERGGKARMEAVRQLSEGRGTVETSSYRSLSEMPPELRERAAQMARSGKPARVERTVTSWSASSGEPPPPELLEALPGATVTKDGRVIVRQRGSRLRILLVLLLLLLVGVLPAVIGLVAVLRGHRSVPRPAPAEKSIQELETILRKTRR